VKETQDEVVALATQVADLKKSVEEFKTVQSAGSVRSEVEGKVSR
jgi:hypothetical protein